MRLQIGLKCQRPEHIRKGSVARFRSRDARASPNTLCRRGLHVACTTRSPSGRSVVGRPGQNWALVNQHLRALANQLLTFLASQPSSPAPKLSRRLHRHLVLDRGDCRLVRGEPHPAGLEAEKFLGENPAFSARIRGFGPLKVEDPLPTCYPQKAGFASGAHRWGANAAYIGTD